MLGKSISYCMFTKTVYNQTKEQCLYRSVSLLMDGTPTKLVEVTCTVSRAPLIVKTLKSIHFKCSW